VDKSIANGSAQQFKPQMTNVFALPPLRTTSPPQSLCYNENVSKLKPCSVRVKREEGSENV